MTTHPNTTEQVRAIAKELYAEMHRCDFDDQIQEAFMPIITQAIAAAEERGMEEGSRKTLRELDIGNHNYLTARRTVADISGMPLMALTFDQHLDVIKDKLQTPPPTNNQ